jgi:hypothetical protein
VSDHLLCWWFDSKMPPSLLQIRSTAAVSSLVKLFDIRRASASGPRGASRGKEHDIHTRWGDNVNVIGLGQEGKDIFSISKVSWSRSMPNNACSGRSIDPKALKLAPCDVIATTPVLTSDSSTLASCDINPLYLCQRGVRTAAGLSVRRCLFPICVVRW